MYQKVIIFRSELVFRKFVILNLDQITQVLVFEDVLDQTIFFYCFYHKELLAATKEISSNNFEKYKEKYIKLAKNLNFRVEPCYDSLNVVKLKR